MGEKIERFGSAFAPGDKVMQTENDNDREVFNGDIGRVLRIDQTEGVLITDFDGREVEYRNSEISLPGKGVGSTPAVVPIVAGLLDRCWWRTHPRAGDASGAR